MLIQVTSFPADSKVRELMEYAVGFDPEREKEAWKLYESSKDAELFVYKEEEQVVGLIGLSFANSEQMNVLHLAIDPEDRFKGYGRGLIVEALLLKRPRLVTAVTDEEGADFFRNIGFTVNGFIPSSGGAEQFRCVYNAGEDNEN
ncbi:acetyltransferase (GNAT) family protein [Fontibacillus phaseoli]|uniref:Acetyltransferase (GNAT) family protein n=1 Tax=Fontibacillus phaseoli TaxID=1416533 RepID=A0A369BNY1_9BACL|nr:GNAT family N-acetyltransferase [Fontibacillus phaseoli]RCX21384.1 acetyltransferase (GNAT) family protein [Fontibacillus phaseoli]